MSPLRARRACALPPARVHRNVHHLGSAGDLSPLHGLPVAHKDLHDTAGVRTTYGSRILKDNIPKQDAMIVERIAKAGAISVGNDPE